jgi:hypothetical protein
VMTSLEMWYGFGGKNAVKNGDEVFLASHPSSVNIQNPSPESQYRVLD